MELFKIVQITALTGLHDHHLRYLDRSDIIKPVRYTPAGHLRSVKRYTWEQLLELKVIASLPKNVSPKQIKGLQDFLLEFKGDSRLATANILIAGENEFYFVSESDFGKILVQCLGNNLGQTAMEFVIVPNPMQALFNSEHGKVLNLRQRFQLAIAA